MKTFLLVLVVTLAATASSTSGLPQGRIDGGTKIGVIGVKIALPEFQAGASDAKTIALTAVFNKALWDDLDFSGGLTLVSRSLYPLGKFSGPGDIKPDDWTTPAVDAQFIAFGVIRATGGGMSAEARLWDLKTTQNRETIGQLYRTEDTDVGARYIAHKFADAIIDAIGGGRGIAQTKIAYIGERPTGVKELYVMDYDGNDSQAMTAYKNTVMSPAWSPDGEKIAFATFRHGSSDIEILGVSSGAEAFSALLDRPFDCAVLDLRLPDMTGFELLEKIQSEPAMHNLPIIVFTGKDLSSEEEARLRQVAKTIVLKDVHSLERLLDETALFLHRVVTDLPEDKKKILQQLHGSNEALHGRKVLIVDDDARNIYALATVLESADMEAMSATNGRQAIEMMQSTPDIAVVLMDIMMPEMDGYQTMREIRKETRFRALPILALTAKAMKGDREKCLEAGASDYIAKPVNTDQLLSLLRVWLFR